MCIPGKFNKNNDLCELMVLRGYPLNKGAVQTTPTAPLIEFFGQSNLILHFQSKRLKCHLVQVGCFLGIHLYLLGRRYRILTIPLIR